MTEVKRGQWNSEVQFMLTCIGYAVGLGNIWRFPYLAYENGGGAFLIPYVFCSLSVGLPLLYMEMCIGQFTRSGPAVIYGRLIPALQGLGVAMTCISMLIAIYYNVIIAWVMIYLYTIITGQSGTWTTCTNYWNTPGCVTHADEDACQAIWPGSTYFNGTCHAFNDSSSGDRERFIQEHALMSPIEEFYDRYVLERNDDMYDLGGMNWKMVVSLALVWIITALCLSKGVKYIGRISFFTATCPYIIIAILFVRGVTLDGAKQGIDYYLLNPDFSYLGRISTWKAAATQVCYSLAVGMGGIISLSSYNSFNHNCFRDSIILCLSDSFMSIFGGTAVFSVLGFMAKRMNVPVNQVLQSGNFLRSQIAQLNIADRTGLAFVAYPEAFNKMPLSWFWSTLFFVMLAILGLSTQFGVTEV
ncbi:unnamed protein product [Anisakis simplex]|uniref:Transporter n=1 Tax=Anisakis simplex TaxID=6269 RepID=A0A0M3K5N7_ANISI|nr:unnamed protein product [Anisakis simplex]